MSSASSYRVGKSTQRTSTCDMCKSRHQKCSGAQPRCNNCDLRGINCSYSKRPSIADSSNLSHESIFTQSTEPGSIPSLSSSEYARLYSQIFGDIVQGLNLDRQQNPGIHGEAFVDSRLCNASLPSFYREVFTLVEEQATLESGQATSQSNINLPPTRQMRDLALERNLEHGRKILRESLPPQDVSLRLLDLFFDYQNSLFYICSLNEARAQLALMYEDPNQVSVSWFCQMFLIFSIAIQFDDLDDADGAAYYEIGKKYMDDAVEENPQNTLWVVRAMLLLCFYKPPTKWASIWIYLDAAIRGAQRFQLDLGHNQLEELSDKEYQEWRQLWLTIISFDRWVAIFLGRLPRIKESISRDPVFKGIPFKPSTEFCMMQNNVTSLAIISGNILRDMYFSEEFSLSVCRQYNNELDTWMVNLPSLLRKYVESGMIPQLPNDQAEAVLNLHFMLFGARMLLTRPLLLKAVKSKMSPNGFTGPIVSAITSDAGACVNYAFQMIASAKTMLLVSLPPRRLFMPVFFLINAANIVVLGAVWKRNQNSKGDSLPTTYDQSRELAALDATTRVLDFCGQRSPFARKYSILVKSLSQQLNKAVATSIGDEAYPTSAVTRIASESLTPYDRSVTGGSEFSSNSDSTSPFFQNVGVFGEDIRKSTSLLTDGDKSRGHYGSIGFLDAGFEPWSEQYGMLYPAEYISPYDSTNLPQRL